MNGLRAPCALPVIAVFFVGCATTPSQPVKQAKSLTELTIFHNNDGESQLLHAGRGMENFGGVANFSTKLQQLIKKLPAETNHLVVSSGDNILPGPELEVSQRAGVPFLDSKVLNHLKYNAICLGNHDFDLGPDVLADLISGTNQDITFVAANIDVSKEPKLAALQKKGRIAAHKIVEFADGEKIGIIGIVTPRLPSISAPRKVEVSGRLAHIVQSEVQALQKKGINKIVLLSHLQDISIEVELIKEIDGVDVVIGGGGDELLSNQDTLLVPGDEKASRGPYPLMVNDKSGRRIPVVTTAGSFRYIGQLKIKFTSDGHVHSVDKSSGIFRVANENHEGGVSPDPVVMKEIITPLKKGINAVSKNAIAETKITLEGRRAKVRSQETNLGNLVADAFLWYAQEHALEHNLPKPAVSLVNGGAIRNDSIIPKGSISELEIQKVVPLPGFVSLVRDVPAQQLLDVLEYSFENQGGGAFLQISGIKLKYDPKRNSQRVRSVVLNDGTALVKAGKVVEDAKSVSVATLSFLAKGGGNIPLKGLDYANFAATYKKAVVDYLRHLNKITKKQYGQRRARRLMKGR